MTANHISTDHASRLSASTEAAEQRRAEYLKALPAELNIREDTIQHKLASENASARNKLQKIYNLMTDLVKAAEPYVACKNGCSACCHMNVVISPVEAKYIEQNTGIKPAQVTGSIYHSLSEFVGIPCPFLIEGSCSIYEFRPFACRKHMSFDTSPYYCEPKHSLEAEVPLIEFCGAEGAFYDIVRFASGGVFADVRDFFKQPCPSR